MQTDEKFSHIKKKKKKKNINKCTHVYFSVALRWKNRAAAILPVVLTEGFTFLSGVVG